MCASSHLEIRLAKPDDAESVAAIYAPIVRDTHLSAEFDVPTPEEMRRRIADTLLTHPWLVAERGGEIIGYAYATSHRSRSAYQWIAEVSVYIRPTDHRRGVAQALYTRLLA
ncbi:MAG: N-acetyltransferase family protein, partial [Phycisphaerales bacterium]|nr:N-acetyltransferase family protein [Phycisphaerales bacterium]